MRPIPRRAASDGGRSREAQHPEQLVERLDEYFSAFDELADQHRVQRLKTIGDGYMCVAGLPEESDTHALDTVLTALAMRDFIREHASFQQQEGRTPWSVRIGVHTGTVVAGVVGRSRVAYDIWGDAVNIASRLESSGSADRVNISQQTYDLVGDLFVCESRGLVEVKNKGKLGMYFVDGVKPDFASPDGPNVDAMREALRRRAPGRFARER